MTFNPAHIAALLEDLASQMARLLEGRESHWSHQCGANLKIDGLLSEPSLVCNGFEIKGKSQHERLMLEAATQDAFCDFRLLVQEIAAGFPGFASQTLRISLFFRLPYRAEPRARLTLNGLALGGSSANLPLSQIVEKLVAAQDTMAAVTTPGSHSYQVSGHSVPVLAGSPENALRIFAAISFPALVKDPDADDYRRLLADVRDHPFPEHQKDFA